MRLLGVISTAVLSLSIAAPVYAQQEQHEQQEKDKPAQEEKKAQPEKAAKPQNKNTQQEEKSAQQQDKNKNQEQKSAQQEKNTQQEQKSAQQEKNTQQEQKNAQQRNSQQAQPEKQAQRGGNGRIPDDRYRANFGREHTFRVTQGDYRNHRFQYGGYWFGFSDPWPSNWLYSQDVFVVDINGVYYLCNPMYPGVNIALNITL
jgi:outer membrane biosynthesis protein TonB